MLYKTWETFAILPYPWLPFIEYKKKKSNGNQGDKVPVFTSTLFTKDEIMLAAHANERSIVSQKLPTLLDLTCCVGLRTGCMLLRSVGS